MKLYKIEAGTFNVDGGAAFGVVPKIVWKKRYPCNDDNYCRVSMRCLLIDTGEKLILIDTGTGDKQLDYLKYFGFEGVINFENVLSEYGYTCKNITDVILTHLHFDHCGGTTKFNENKTKVEMVFPNATHWVCESQWQNFLNPNIREGDSYFPENMMPILEAGKISFVNENQYICPEIEVRIFNGHTVGQLVSYIDMGEKTLVYAGDVIPLSANVPLAWISSYDINPIEAMKEKKILLDEAAEKQQIIYFEHDNYTECCTVIPQYNKHKVDQTFTFDELKLKYTI